MQTYRHTKVTSLSCDETKEEPEGRGALPSWDAVQLESCVIARKRNEVAFVATVPHRHALGHVAANIHKPLDKVAHKET